MPISKVHSFGSKRSTTVRARKTTTPKPTPAAPKRAADTDCTPETAARIASLLRTDDGRFNWNCLFASYPHCQIGAPGQQSPARFLNKLLTKQVRAKAGSWAVGL